MTDDSFGFALNTEVRAAAEACARGMHGYCYWRADAMAALGKAAELDPGFAMPRLAIGWILHLARSDAYRGKVDSLLAETAAMAPMDTRERAYRDALVAASAGDAISAATALEGWLLSNPTDLFAHRIVQFELFWCGRAAWMRDLTELAAPAWSRDTPGYGMFLSCRAFANEEAGDYGAAERFGRDAVAWNLPIRGAPMQWPTCSSCKGAPTWAQSGYKALAATGKTPIRSNITCGGIWVCSCWSKGRTMPFWT